MMQNRLFNAAIFILTALFLTGGEVSVYSQTPEAAVKPSVVTGDVATVSGNGIIVNTKAGPVNVSFTEKTEFKRVSAEKPDLKTATPAASSDVGAGDKVIVTGILSKDGKSIPARSVFLMTKSDIAQKATKEIEQWRTRGINGKVLSIDPASKQITVQIAGLMRNTSMLLTPKENAQFLRYAPDSIRFDEAKASSISEIQVGDMLRALGDKSADGTSFAAEEVVSGAFQTLAGTVKSVDAVKGEVVISDLKSKKDITVVVTESSVLKKFPPEMAQRMAGSQAGPGGARPPGGGRPPEADGQSQGNRGGGQGRGLSGGRAGGIDDMLERFPTITPSDLKPGDMIAISSSKGSSTDRVKAIKLLAGVEPFLQTARATGGGNQRNQGVPGGLSIPGLEGIGFP